VSVCI